PFGGRNPLYAVIHESCWADGVATRWAADRTMPAAVREDPTLLAGEHIHRDLFAEDPELEVWAEAADLLAEHEWPALYDEAALRAADVPGAAAVYYDDAYVPRESSMATAALLPSLRTWVTSEYEHNGLRASGETVLDRLLDLAPGRRAASAAAAGRPPRRASPAPARHRRLRHLPARRRATPLHSSDPIRQRAISGERVGASGRGPLRGRMVAARRQPLHRRACAPRRYVTYVSTSASRPPRSCDRATPKLTSGRQWLD